MFHQGTVVRPNGVSSKPASTFQKKRIFRWAHALSSLTSVGGRRAEIRDTVPADNPFK